MSEIKFYIASFIFIVLTAIKITMPALSDDISYEISKVLITEKEQTVSVMELGKSLYRDSFFEAFNKTEIQPDKIPVSEVINFENILPMPKEEVPEEEPEISPKVEAFLQSQEAYSEYAVPANVSYDLPELPFKYESPIIGCTSSGFGYRLHPICNEVKYHYGTDLAAAYGSEIRAFADGTVRAIGEESGGYGKYIIIDHADGYSTLYAHCSELCVSSGEVKRGDVIALVGQTGAATGPHLHFELMCGETYLNPEFYV